MSSRKISQHWSIEDGALVQTTVCENFQHAVNLLNQISVLAEEVRHHPDLCIHDYKYVTIALKSHDKDAITDRDYDLAGYIDNLLDREE